MVSDGSYMRDRHVGACSCGFIFECKETGKRATCTWAELQTTSDNYRGELLGAIGLLSVLHAILSDPTSLAIIGRSETELVRTLYTDCKGVIRQGNNPKRKLKHDQAHADLILTMREMIKLLPIRVRFKYVRGHLDKHIPRDLLTPIQRLNCDADKLAKRALRRAIRENRFINCVFSHDPVTIEIGGHRIIRSPTDAIYSDTGRRTARAYYARRNKIAEDDFDLVNWDALERAMKYWAVLYRVFYSKHMTGCCGVKHFENIITRGATSAACPCCPDPDETTLHVFLCENETRRKLYFESIDKFERWLRKRKTDPDLTSMLVQYLKGRGEVTMVSCLSRRASKLDSFRQLAAEQDRLGFQNLSEGRVSTLFERIQCARYKKIKSRRSSAKWAAELVDQLFHLVHLQWTYRNKYLHFRAHDGAETVTEYEERMKRIADLFNTVEPEDLLEEDRYLVTDHSPEELAASSTQPRILWEEEVAAARSAAFFERVRCDLAEEAEAEIPGVVRPEGNSQESM